MFKSSGTFIILPVKELCSKGKEENFITWKCGGMVISFIWKSEAVNHFEKKYLCHHSSEMSVYGLYTRKQHSTFVGRYKYTADNNLGGGLSCATKCYVMISIWSRLSACGWKLARGTPNMIHLTLFLKLGGLEAGGLLLLLGVLSNWDWTWNLLGVMNVLIAT